MEEILGHQLDLSESMNEAKRQAAFLIHGKDLDIFDTPARLGSLYEICVDGRLEQNLIAYEETIRRRLVRELGVAR